MKTFKIIFSIAALVGMIACSSNRKKTTETAAAPAPIMAEPQLSPPPAPSQPAYTLADLGASSAGRSK